MLKFFCALLFTPAFLLFQQDAFAADTDLIVNEVMYDFPDSDTNHEWVELYNQGSGPVTIIGGSASDAWRINDGSNHTLDASPTQGSLTVASQEFIVVAQNPLTFLTDYPDFSGNLVGSSALSLGNTSGTVSLRIGSSGALWGQLSYQKDQGGAGDNNSLQRKDDGTLIAASPTPGEQNADTPAPSPDPSPSQQSSPSPSPTPTKAPSPSPTPAKSPTPTPKLKSPSPSPSPQNSPQVLGLNVEDSSPSPSPTPEGKSSKSSLKVAGILTGAGSILIALSIGFYLWYSKVFNKPKNIQENPNESPTNGS